MSNRTANPTGRLIPLVLMACIAVVGIWEVMANRSRSPFQPFDLTAADFRSLALGRFNPCRLLQPPRNPISWPIGLHQPSVCTNPLSEVRPYWCGWFMDTICAIV